MGGGAESAQTPLLRKWGAGKVGAGSEPEDRRRCFLADAGSEGAEMARTAAGHLESDSHSALEDGGVGVEWWCQALFLRPCRARSGPSGCTHCWVEPCGRPLGAKFHWAESPGQCTCLQSPVPPGVVQASVPLLGWSLGPIRELGRIPVPWGPVSPLAGHPSEQALSFPPLTPSAGFDVR